MKIIFLVGCYYILLNYLRKKYIELNDSIIKLIIETLSIFLAMIMIRKVLVNSRIIYLIGFIVVFFITLSKLKFCKNEKIFELFIKKRYLIALVIFVLCVAFKVNGSAINVYNNEFTDLSIYDHVLFGGANSLRSDEFNVQTPYYFSQRSNNYKKKSYQMSMSGQDMILGYNAPVKDLTLISKPFTWGYVLLGNSYGLSWYWCMKTILCLLVMFELCRLITDGNDRVAAVGSIIIVFSPAMQWWFSPHMYDVFFWSSALLVIGYYFFMEQEGKRKIIITSITPFAVVGFVLALFPSLQITLGALALALLIVLLVRDRQNFKINKWDILRILFVIVIIAIVLGSCLTDSMDAISLTSNTVYPGKRIATGGDSTFRDLFLDLQCFIAPYIPSNYSNNSEISTFNHLGILCVMIFPYIMHTSCEKKKKYVGITLFFCVLFEAYFMLIGIPETIAKITLLSYVNRMKIVYGFTALLFTIWTFDILIEFRNRFKKSYLISILSIYSIMQYFTINQFNKQLLPVVFFIIILCIYISNIMLYIIDWKSTAIVLTCVIVFVSGCTINPLCIGANAIEGHTISKVVKRINKKNDGYWIVPDALIVQNFLLANGCKVLNAVNFYPDLKKWNLIDKTLEYDDAYNRYAHIIVTLTSNKTKIEEGATADVVNVYLNYSDLKLWKIKYILAKKIDSKELKKVGIFKKEIFADETGYSIYQLNY